MTGRKEGAPLDRPDNPGAPAALHRPGKVRPMILLWALGVPIPLIVIIFLVRGCMT